MVAGIAIVHVGLALAVYRDLAPPSLPKSESIAGLSGVSAEVCRPCHATIYAEWARSGHARAFVDPLYQRDLAHHDTTFACERCHTPLVEQRESRVFGLAMAWPVIVPLALANTSFDPVLQREGVTCVACHLIEGELRGPFDDASAAPHPTGFADLRTPELCARCHQLDFTIIGRKLDRPVLDTVAEWRAFAASGGQESCVDCHMPSAVARAAALEGPTRPGTRHDLPGPFDPAFVGARVIATAQSLALTDGRGARAIVEIENRSGHRVPTAEPQRALVVTLAALDREGLTLSSAEVRIARPIDVPRLRPLGPDTTLGVGERREVALALPGPVPAATAALAVTVDFVMWDPSDPVLAELDDRQPSRHRLLDHRVPTEPP